MDRIVKIVNHSEAQALLGTRDENIRTIEKEFSVKIVLRGEHLKISGTASNIKKSAELIESVLDSIRSGQSRIGASDLHYMILSVKKGMNVPALSSRKNGAFSSFTERKIAARTKGQREYVESMEQCDIVFGIGPAGTGKTYLAMACAVESLKKQQVRRIILTRPAIEAGESLGYLPGDIYEKISPYLRPLYDALYDMMEAEKIEKYLETGIIEVAPLAYMRGRTLNDAFIILDEAQNCTAEQMKMFLTRLGFDSKAVITGDMTQSDLADGKPIGLLQAEEILKGIKGIKFIYLTGQDVVRHELVQRIIEAYDKATHHK
ncbi:MAG: PhoH family protein [Candidatus Omnitrophica bacterium]|nr:PhoH family protein [Candidatus Omnitrophota bacterium]